MFSANWKTALGVTLAWAGLALGQAPSSPPGIGIGSDLLTVREAGRPDQKCRILKTWKQTDGTMAFEVQCLETEEHLTLVEMAPSEAGVTDPGKGMKSRIYHWGQSVTPPAGVPQMPTAPSQPSKDSTAGSEMTPPMPTTPMRSTEKDLPEKPEINSVNKKSPQSSPASEAATVPSPSSTVADKVEPKYALPESPETKLGPVQVETARPSNWHESWGKADDHHTQLTTEKISQPPAANSAADQRLPMPVEQPSATSRSEDVKQMPLPAEPAAPAAAPDSEPSLPASLPSTTGSDDKAGDNSPDLSRTSGKKEIVPEPIQPAGYSHVDDRPGIAHVTDIPPAGAAKASGESKKPVVDFIRAMWKPSLKEPAPLQTAQINEMPVAAAVPDAMQIQATLQNSLLPSQREMAAEILSNWDGHREPTIIPALLRAATDDPAATVRAACVHCLVKMRANTPQVVSVLLSLKADPDLRVRREAHQALVSFGLAKPESENETVHQISAPAGPVGDW